MKATRSQASKRVFKMLSALRATLSNEEREILDDVVVTEVAAHKLTSKAVDKAVDKATNKSTFRIAFDPQSEEYKIVD